MTTKKHGDKIYRAIFFFAIIFASFYLAFNFIREFVDFSYNLKKYKTVKSDSSQMHNDPI